jgi:hypothetical protein
MTIRNIFTASHLCSTLQQIRFTHSPFHEEVYFLLSVTAARSIFSDTVQGIPAGQLPVAQRLAVERVGWQRPQAEWIEFREGVGQLSARQTKMLDCDGDPGGA